MSAVTKILLVEHGVPPVTFSVITCLKQSQKCELHVLSFGSQRNPFYKYSKHVKSFEHYISSDYDDALEKIKNTAIRLKIDILVPLMEHSVDIVSRRLNELKGIVHVPPVPTPNKLDVVFDKWLLQNWLYANKYTDMKPIHFSDLFDGRKSEQNLSYPFLIKPFWGSDGKGIVKISNRNEYLKIFKQEWPEHEFMLVQPYIEGFDIDISFLAEDGKILAYTIQKGLVKEKLFHYSKNIRFLKDDRLLEITTSIIRDLNYSGVAHLDFRYDIINLRYELVDFNTRYWGSLLGSLHAGINFPDLACKRAMGQEIVNQEYNIDNYFETINVFRIFFNTIFRKGENVATLNNSRLKYLMQDPNAFLYYLLNRFLAKFR